MINFDLYLRATFQHRRHSLRSTTVTVPSVMAVPEVRRTADLRRESCLKLLIWVTGAARVRTFELNINIPLAVMA